METKTIWFQYDYELRLLSWLMSHESWIRKYTLQICVYTKMLSCQLFSFYSNTLRNVSLPRCIVFSRNFLFKLTLHARIRWGVKVAFKMDANADVAENLHYYYSGY